MKRINYLAALLFSGLWTSVCALGLFGNDVGVGVRALSFANNHTAVVNDLSAAYWNPAALAFLPVREFQVSIDGSRAYGTFDALRVSDYQDRIRISSIGAMSAIPTVQGGLTIAAAYQNPYTFDEFSIYKYKGYRQDGSIYTGKAEFVTYGGLDNWSGSFGIQVAQGLSAGATVSLITGTERERVTFSDVDEVELECKYMGLGLRAGLLYAPEEFLKLGMQISAPQSMRFKEKETDDGIVSHDNGRVYRAPSGSLGAGITLPWVTIAFDGRFTMPYTFILPSEKIPENSQAKYFKLGGGIGVEAPLSFIPVVLRGGYSYDEYDLFSRVLKYDGETIDWGQRYSVDKNLHTITAGVGVFTSGTGLELSYGYQTWATAYKGSDYYMPQKQNFSSHRVAAGFIVRY
ncbi:MAG: hypothetical protein LBB56_04650 [Chitinispirillales bacterium]|nr:hypothetical protein [Chitinispirillales bacterium]